MADDHVSFAQNKKDDFGPAQLVNNPKNALMIQEKTTANPI
jgi:hypothetical protein